MARTSMAMQQRMNIQSGQNDQDKEEEAMAQRRQSVSLAPAGLDSESASTFQCVPESTQEQGQCAKLPETIPGVLQCYLVC